MSVAILSICLDASRLWIGWECSDLTPMWAPDLMHFYDFFMAYYLYNTVEQMAAILPPIWHQRLQMLLQLVSNY
ncbi:GL16239 [Drosophila persimilis]|uniref:GL16239 n=1 Tax=Drosophila persimilis TaxID=7234 RepID=B4GQL2_DROPE|nr:GL16239 [Drosophila persimilis]